MSPSLYPNLFNSIVNNCLRNHAGNLCDQAGMKKSRNCLKKSVMSKILSLSEITFKNSNWKTILEDTLDICVRHINAV